MLTEELDVFTESRLPLQERVVDKLADIMFASDMILDMLKDDRFAPAHQLAEVGTAVKRVYDQIDELMRQLTD
jgi:uncharacterized coiled-coil protein SlyX